MHLDKGSVLDTDKDVHEVSRLAKRIRHGKYARGTDKRAKITDDFIQDTPSNLRRRSKKRKILTI